MDNMLGLGMNGEQLEKTKDTSEINIDSGNCQIDKLLCCPFCGGVLVKGTDHNGCSGAWIKHKSKCILNAAHYKFIYEAEFSDWNQRVIG